MHAPVDRFRTSAPMGRRWGRGRPPRQPDRMQHLARPSRSNSPPIRRARALANGRRCGGDRFRQPAPRCPPWHSFRNALDRHLPTSGLWSRPICPARRPPTRRARLPSLQHFWAIHLCARRFYLPISALGKNLGRNRPSSANGSPSFALITLWTNSVFACAKGRKLSAICA